MARFTLPRDIYFGDGAISTLSTLTGYSRAMVITGGTAMKKAGFLDKTVLALREGGLETKVFDGVEPDPSIETVFTGAQLMRDFKPDLIVALGGGSPMDAAKAMWVFYEAPDKTFDDIKEPFSLPVLRKKAHFAAIPSTSGSASEVTAFAVITDYATKVKYPLADFEITPDIAILDTSIPQTMPPTLVAHTGMDALTHAIEAYTATARSPFSDPLALQAISDVLDALLDSYHGDRMARGKMHIAQCLAGMAFSNALLGIAHSLAHKVGALFGLPHGLCNAILLPAVVQFNARACEDRYAAIARHLGMAGGTNKQLTDSLVRRIRCLRDSLGINGCFRDNGVPESLLKQNLSFVVDGALHDPCTSSNPRPITGEQMENVLLCAYYGEDVTF